jgi:hypothetical protein
MGIAAAWRALWAPERKASRAGPLMALMSAGQPAPTPRRYDKLAEEGFQKNAVVFRCVNLVAECTAAVPWRLFRGRGRDRRLVDSHPLLDLLARPNPLQGGSGFLHGVYATRLLAGNSYVEAVGPSEGPNAGRPRELWSLRPDRMQVVKGEDGQPAGYQFRTWQVDPVTGRSAVLHSKSFHGLCDRHRAAGLSAQTRTATGGERYAWARGLLEGPLQHAARQGAAGDVRQRTGETDMNAEMVMGFIRHALTFGGGILVSKGVVEASEVETAVAALVTLIGLGWSIWQKRRTT